jgi:hypothetical protein
MLQHLYRWLRHTPVRAPFRPGTRGQATRRLRLLLCVSPHVQGGVVRGIEFWSVATP